MQYLRKSIVPVAVIALVSFPALGGSNNHHNNNTNNTSYADTSLAEGIYDLTSFDDSVVLSSTGVTVGGVNVTLSGWSDTGNTLDPELDDTIVKTATAYEISNYYGYGVLNQDGEGQTSPNHSIDNYYYNGTNNADGIQYADFDFVLFTFDSDVTLDGLDFGWVNNNGNDQQLSVAALGDSQLGLLEGEQSSWAQIIAGAVSESFNIANNSVTTGIDSSIASQYWLVGAYNTVFGSVNGASMYNDGFKITSVYFTENTSTPPGAPTAVHEPGLLGLMLMSIGILAWRRKRVA
ncbi:PEP-CTERM sorting domain-containing protein [Alteromonas sp. 1_MG-2023]|uniref:exosortase-dependent surface protein XDP1 n=1 Tax=Alteromonas sp. 1_MG-2023 TaxID=3062669 RepID=UPI0026E2EB61|nr:exosortase-dependent surface protein XDP1 [Alteromonas sp. 1_MG-2023]MDO6566145.1 PEP-CTERM sorting domain-containing protein [Alteromonas sp. 1_MG-2023]